MGGINRTGELVTPPIEYEGQDGVYGGSKKEQAKQEIELCLAERLGNFIKEKTSYCLKKGLSIKDTEHIMRQVVKNIPNTFSLFNFKSIEQTEKQEDVAVLQFQQAPSTIPKAVLLQGLPYNDKDISDTQE
ncbi:MAG: hypothetical protein HUT38_03005 [Candidatus Paceibacter sp.]|nr:hypothetical protein [Candidatus Paceibacter sp.]